MTTADGRLREPPRMRFAGAERKFDLAEAFEALPSESILRHGHIQKTLYKHGPMTTAVFSITAGEGLDRHELDGEAIIQVNSGHIEVHTPTATHELTDNQILLLDPKTPHDVKAVKDTNMVMTVVLEGNR